jgi:putative acetyltransferase
MYCEDISNTTCYAIEAIRLDMCEPYHALLSEAAVSEKYLGMASPPPLDAIEGSVKESVDNGYPMYLATTHEKPIGWCCIYQNSHTNFQHLGQLFIGVLKPWQGLGVGKTLLSTAIQKGWENGLRRIELEVCVSNAPAIRLYSKFGFQTEGIKRDAYFIEGEYEDLLVMSLLQKK